MLGSLVTIVAFFAVAELATRTESVSRGNGFFLALHELDATDSAVNEIYQFHPFAGFIFKPGIIFPGGHPAQNDTVEIRTDEHGFLSDSRELLIAKGSNEVRIATIGASTTANINLAYAENWPGRLGELLQQALPDKKVTVINAAVPGFNTAQSIGNLALRVLPFKPDVVIIYNAYNDLKLVRPDFEIKPDFSNVHRVPYGQHRRPSFLLRLLNGSMFYVRMRNSYRKYKTANSHIAVIAGGNRLERVPPQAATIFEHNMRMLIAIATAGGAKVVLSSFATLHELDAEELAKRLTLIKNRELFAILNFTPGLSLNGVFSGLSTYNKILEELAEEQNTGWVDNAARIAHDDKNFVDRVHFSPSGAEQMAQNFLPTVLEQLSIGVLK